MSDVDVIAYPDTPFRTGRDSQLAEMRRETLQRIINDGGMRARSMLHKRVLDALVKTGFAPDVQMNPHVAEGFRALEARYGRLPKARYYGHHLSHAAAAYLTSGFDDAAVVTLDGRGGPLSGATWAARDDRIERIDEEPYTNSLGWFYRDCTRYAGLGDFGEGKFMGLAPYGMASKLAGVMRLLIDTAGDRWFAVKRKPHPSLTGFQQREEDDILSGPYADFAAAAQHAVERSVERAVRSAVGRTRSNRVCLGGGVAMNCSANGRLLASSPNEEFWLFPASGDAGLSVGAALLAARDLHDPVGERVESPYWGPSFSDIECEAALSPVASIEYSRPDNLGATVATALADGKIAGWFQGRMELGPRALGNRSIVADPRTIGMRDRVNRVKGREMWRPLAPSILAGRTLDYFENVPPNAFMLFAVQAREITRNVAPAIVHVDGSARPQPVTRELNERYYDLIAAFDRITGVPIVLNTSFNIAREPIVCTPQDALETFLACDLDMLVLGSFVVTKQR